MVARNVFVRLQLQAHPQAVLSPALPRDEENRHIKRRRRDHGKHYVLSQRTSVTNAH